MATNLFFSATVQASSIVPYKDITLVAIYRADSSPATDAFYYLLACKASDVVKFLPQF